jgi:dsDNA-binding SOS-regulon protein
MINHLRSVLVSPSFCSEADDVYTRKIKPPPMAQSHQAEALRLAIETTAQALAVEEENKGLRAQLQKNLELLDNFDAVVPRAQQLQQQLRQKKAEVEAKQAELIGLQSAIIATIKNPPAPPAGQSETLAVIPVVMGKVQKDITSLTDAAVSEKSITVPILSLYKVSDGLHKLYETLVDQKVIEEGQEEKQERLQRYLTAQREVLLGLKTLAQQASAPPPAPRVVEVATDAPDEPLTRAPTPEPPAPPPAEGEGSG